MSREIKYRVWDKDRSVFLTHHDNDGFDLYILLPDDSMWLDIGEGVMYPADKDRFVLMQYTGLKDKEGREIYEGDILEFYWQSETLAGHDRAVVDWIGDSFRIRGGITGNPSMPDVCRVIGNRYEHPDLLDRRQLP